MVHFHELIDEFKTEVEVMIMVLFEAPAIGQQSRSARKCS